MRITLPSNLSMVILTVMSRDLAWAKLVGGRVCLDFFNTLSNRNGPAPRDHLEDYGVLVDWARQAGIVDAAHARRLHRRAAADADGAAEVLAQARALREALFRIFRALEREEAPAAPDVACLNVHLARAQAAARLSWQEGRLALEWNRGDALSAPLDPIVRSAAELLLSDERARVRMCEADDCGWMFLDQTRSHTRRWCDMRDCGNRAKARRHYARKKAET